MADKKELPICSEMLFEHRAGLGSENKKRGLHCADFFFCASGKRTLLLSGSLAGVAQAADLLKRRKAARIPPAAIRTILAGSGTGAASAPEIGPKAINGAAAV